MRLDVFEVFRGKVVSPSNPTFFYSQESRSVPLGLVESVSFHFVIDQVSALDSNTAVYLQESGDGQVWTDGQSLGSLAPLSPDSTQSIVLTSAAPTAARLRLAFKVLAVVSYNMKVVACVRGTRPTDYAQARHCCA
jgi:hypothetical protein